MDIYKRLQDDHRRQRKLAEKVEDTSGDSEDRRRLFAEFKQEAEAHANAEEQTFYAALLEDPDAQEKARHSISEHKEAADLLDELSDLDMASSQWIRTFKQLVEDLEHHMDEEEDEVFELARSVIDAETAQAMVADFEERKAAEAS